MGIELNLPTALVLMLGLVGITAAVMAFIKTPADQRFRARPKTLEERRAACPPEAQAVILKGDWRRALRRDLPWLIAASPALALALWFKASEGDACATLLGYSRAQIAWAGLLYGMPLAAVVAVQAAIRQGVALIRGGHFPPLTAVPYVDTLAIGGRGARLRGWGMCLAALLVLGLLAYGYAGLAGFLDGRDLWTLLAAKSAAACPAAP